MGAGGGRGTAGDGGGAAGGSHHGRPQLEERRARDGLACVGALLRRLGQRATARTAAVAAASGAGREGARERGRVTLTGLRHAGRGAAALLRAGVVLAHVHGRQLALVDVVQRQVSEVAPLGAPAQRAGSHHRLHAQLVDVAHWPASGKGARAERLCPAVSVRRVGAEELTRQHGHVPPLAAPPDPAVEHDAHRGGATHSNAPPPPGSRCVGRAREFGARALFAGWWCRVSGERERGGVFFKTGRALAPALLSAEKPAVRFPAPAHLFVLSPVL